ncbi:glycoside hydrolase family 88 protein [uncultured Draconibacterium sp.]|uniref:glycoside hydrolase family 88 protein n=1 Tax=uncultured Draconibacterium sp. TaxID=1573823 RepID=UPI0032609247
MNLLKSKRATILLLILILFACSDNNFSIEKNLNFSTQQIASAIETAYEFDKAPRGMKEVGSIKFMDDEFDWTEGFFPGLCWLLYDYSQDEEFKKAAEYFQAKYEEHKYYATNHDLGFIFNCSFGNGYRITDNKQYKEVLITATESLIKRYNPNVGCIQSWDTDRGWQKSRGWQFPVIIDNMMNLEMLFEATKLTGNQEYHNIAVNHANATLDNHFREDFSSYHVIDYDKDSGKVRNRHTAQGYSHESAWARGQAWGLYGFTMCYRYTNDERYLKLAEEIANFLLSHPNLPKDKIPYWDFDAPKNPEALRDVSAASIISSALLELDGYSAKDYKTPAKEMLISLSSKKYQTGGKENILILGHSVGSIPHGAEIDVPIVYADYYYVEALLRLRNLQNKKESDIK